MCLTSLSCAIGNGVGWVASFSTTCSMYVTQPPSPYQHSHCEQDIAVTTCLLQDLDVRTEQLAVDGPSSKMEQFLLKNYGVERLLRQNNNFAVAPSFFDYNEDVRYVEPMTLLRDYCSPNLYLSDCKDKVPVSIVTYVTLNRHPEHK